MKKEDKKKSIKYWDKHAGIWQERAYDKRRHYLNFPTSQQRQDITIDLIEKLAKNKNASIIDIGSADGELIRGLLKKGFTNVKGIDNSKKMVEAAKRILKQEIPESKPDKVFFVDDADSLKENEKFDFVIAMGLIEYLLDTDSFFEKLNRILKPNGFALIESRNKLFNLFSANEFTNKSSIKNLIKELEGVKKFSPIKKQKEIERIVRETFILIGQNLKKIGEENKKRKKFAQFPFKLPQFSPKEIEDFCQKNNLKLKYVIYYHFHPFLPKYENDFPVVFNEIGLLARPLGYTFLGATTCSSFIAVIKRN